MKAFSRFVPAGIALAVVAMLLLPLRSLSEPAINSIGIPSFDGATGWINSRPLTPQDLEGKTVLVDFFEYTCINCLRTLPYLKEWYRRYHQYGFEIISVQTPEFGFSGDPANVAAAARRLGITWPIVIDANNAIWNRYGNSEWPHEFLFAPNEQLIESFEGEGGYPDTENKIQLILKVGQPTLQLPPVMALLPQDSYDIPGAVCYPMTQEILVGRQPMRADEGGGYVDGQIYVQGRWNQTREADVTQAGGGSLELRYHAIQVEVVMRPQYGPVRVDVTQDGRPVAHDDAGPDVQYDASGNSYVNVDAPRAYDIIRNAQYASSRDLRLTPQGTGLGIYDIAFESCEVPGSH